MVQNEPDCSAHPVNDGRCCIPCDNTVVTPARLRLLGMSDEAANKHAEFSMALYKKSKEDPDWCLKINKGELKQ